MYTIKIIFIYETGKLYKWLNYVLIIIFLFKNQYKVYMDGNINCVFCTKKYIYLSHKNIHNIKMFTVNIK